MGIKEDFHDDKVAHKALMEAAYLIVEQANAICSTAESEQIAKALEVYDFPNPKVEKTS